MTDLEIDDERAKGRSTGLWLAFLFIMSCFLGYQVGADVAHKENAGAVHQR